MSILISKPDSLGDQLLVSGLVRGLAAAFPDQRLAWHVRSGYEAVGTLLAGVALFQPDLSAEPEAERGRFEQLPPGVILLPFPLHPHADWTEATETSLAWWSAFLQASPWRLAVSAVVNRTWVSDVTAGLTRAPRRLGFAATPARQALVNTAHQLIPDPGAVFSELLPATADAAEIDQLTALFSAAAGHPLASPMALRIPDGAADAARRRLALSAGQRLAVIAPGVGAQAQRAWPMSHFEAVADILRQRGFRVAWLEGPADAASFAHFSEEQRREVQAFGPEALAGVAALLGLANLVLCNDTAYVHLAAGLGRPTVALYGAGQGSRFHPREGRVKVIQGQTACAGCQWHCLFDRYHCVQDIPLAAVLESVDAALTGDFQPARISIDVPGGSPAALQRLLQDAILQLDADRFARLQIIQNLLIQRDRRPSNGDGRPRQRWTQRLRSWLRP